MKKIIEVAKTTVRLFWFPLTVFTGIVALAVLINLHDNKTKPYIVHAQQSYNSCDQSKTTTTLLGATAGTAAVQLIAVPSGTPIYVCKVTVVGVSGTTPTFSLVYGTGTNCGTGQHVFLPAITTTANTLVNTTGFFLGTVPAANALCYLDGGTTPIQDYVIVYAQG